MEWTLEDRLERGSGGAWPGAGEEPRRLRALVLDAISSAAADVVASNAAVARWEHRAAATEAELGETSRAGDARISLRRRRLVLVDAANRAAELARLCEAVETFERCREPERDAAAEAALLPEGFLDFSLDEDDDVGRGRDADADGWEEAYEATLERLVAAAEASAEGGASAAAAATEARARAAETSRLARDASAAATEANASRDAAVAAFRSTRADGFAAAFSRAKDSADAISRAASSDVVETFATLLAHLDASLAGRSIAGGGVRGAGDVVVAAGRAAAEASNRRARLAETLDATRKRLGVVVDALRVLGDAATSTTAVPTDVEVEDAVVALAESARDGGASAAAADATATRDAMETAAKAATRAAAALKEEAGLGLVADGGEDGGVADGGEDGGVADDVADDEDEAEESTRESDVTSSASRAPPRARRAAALHRWRGRRHPHAARLLAVVAAKLDGRPRLVETLRRRAGTDVKDDVGEVGEERREDASLSETCLSETPLSVAEDVARLTAMATDPDTLAAMYEGWMPWL